MKQKLTSERANHPVANGIVHFWELPHKLHVILEPNFKSFLFKFFMEQARTIYNANKLTRIPRSSIGRYIHKNDAKICVNSLIKIAQILGIEPKTIEKYILWIGQKSSPGISRPKLPFDFNSKAGVHLIAAICNDGWISDNACYSNNNPELRKSVKNDTITVFGGDESIVHEHVKAKDQILLFTSVIRDTILSIVDLKGIKSEKNPSVPSFILNSKKLMCAWIEQTIADEGCVKHYLKENRRELNWSRVFQQSLPRYNLLEDEKSMLNTLGIVYEVYVVGNYKTARGIDKVRFAIRIAKRENLLKFRKMITIPGNVKDKIFTDLTATFIRYKERSVIQSAILSIHKENQYVTSSLLQERMNYKNVNNAIKWLKLYEKEGFLVCSTPYFYSTDSRGRTPAKYILRA